MSSAVGSKLGLENALVISQPVRESPLPLPQELILNILRHLPFGDIAHVFVRVNYTAKVLGTVALKDHLKAWFIQILHCCADRIASEKLKSFKNDLLHIRRKIEEVDLNPQDLWMELTQYRILIERALATLDPQDLKTLNLSSLTFAHPFKRQHIEMGRTVAYLATLRDSLAPCPGLTDTAAFQRWDDLRWMEGAKVSKIFQTLLQEKHIKGAEDFIRLYSKRIEADDLPWITIYAGIECLSQNLMEIYRRITEYSNPEMTNTVRMLSVIVLAEKADPQWKSSSPDELDQEYKLKERVWIRPDYATISSKCIAEAVISCDTDIDCNRLTSLFCFLIDRGDFNYFINICSAGHRASLLKGSALSFEEYFFAIFIFQGALFNPKVAESVLKLCCWSDFNQNYRERACESILNCYRYKENDTLFNLSKTLSLVRSPSLLASNLKEIFLSLHNSIQKTDSIYPNAPNYPTIQKLAEQFNCVGILYWIYFFIRRKKCVAEVFYHFSSISAKLGYKNLSDNFFDGGQIEAEGVEDTDSNTVETNWRFRAALVRSSGIKEQFEMYLIATSVSASRERFCRNLKLIAESSAERHLNLLTLFFVKDFIPLQEGLSRFDANKQVPEECMRLERLLQWFLIRARNFHSQEAINLIRDLCVKQQRQDLVQKVEQIRLDADPYLPTINNRDQGKGLQWRCSLEFIIRLKKERQGQLTEEGVNKLVLDCLAAHPKVKVSDGKMFLITFPDSFNALLLLWEEPFFGAALVDILYFISHFKTLIIDPKGFDKIMGTIDKKFPHLKDYALATLKTEKECDSKWRLYVDHYYSLLTLFPENAVKTCARMAESQLEIERRVKQFEEKMNTMCSAALLGLGS